MRMGANKIGIQQEAASLSAISLFKRNDASVIQIGGGNNSGDF